MSPTTNEALKNLNIEEAVLYHYGKFPPKSMDSARLLKPLSTAVTALARYDGVLRTLHNSEVLLAPLRAQEAVISSRIEGTVTTLDEVLEYEADVEGDGEGEVGLYRDEVLEVFSYARALRHAQKRMEEGLPISNRLIKEAHRILLILGRGAGKQPGEFKTEQNYIVDQRARKVLFIPAAPDRLEEGMRRLEMFINDPDVEPLLQTALAHIEFESLHPFRDGNGRVGRMLITLMLWQRELIQSPHFYISGYLEDRRDAYTELMRDVSRTGCWTDWCLFFLQAIEAQAEDNLKVAEDIRSLYEEMKLKCRDILSSKWSTAAVDYMFSRPVFRNSHFTNRSGIPRPTAARFTRLLLDAGMLTVAREASGRRSAVLRLESLMELVRR